MININIIEGNQTKEVHIAFGDVGLVSVLIVSPLIWLIYSRCDRCSFGTFWLSPCSVIGLL